MNPTRILAAVFAAALASGCSSTSHCKGEQDYQKAQTVPPLAGVDGLKLPESPSPLRIPPKAESEVAFGEQYKTDNGKTRYRCLDIPPRLELPEDSAEPAPKAEEKPKPDAADVKPPALPGY
ncbi:MAG: hypothetical protein HYV18_02780 [Gammaproteobacteria bacterium]|nr:hypothetical protein [Gammaproteobacteria bacterium]